MSYLLVVNPASGSDADDLPTRATRELNDVRTVELSPDLDLADEITRALGDGRTIIACGGDGTVSAVAQHLAGTRGVMGVLPGGTLNHFARDLGVREPDAAIAVLAEGHCIAVDVGRVGDRVFVNNIGFGIYPEIVREREHREATLGKRVALLASVGRVIVGFDPLTGAISADGVRRILLATAVFVGNNRFSTSPGSIGQRERLDEGILEVRLMRARSGLLGRASAGWHAAVSGPGRIVRTEARHVEIRLRGPRLMALDGEQEPEVAAIDVTNDPGALNVLAPASGSDA